MLIHVIPPNRPAHLIHVLLIGGLPPNYPESTKLLLNAGNLVVLHRWLAGHTEASRSGGTEEQQGRGGTRPRRGPAGGDRRSGAKVQRTRRRQRAARAGWDVVAPRSRSAMVPRRRAGARRTLPRRRAGAQRTQRLRPGPRCTARPCARLCLHRACAASSRLHQALCQQ
jgi:hypothetical protein